MKKLSGLAHAVEVVKKLRSEKGCPWDKAQTHESLRRYLLEETYELLEALDEAGTSAAADDKLEEELGDVLLQVLLHAEIARQRKKFDIEAVAEALAVKLERRHPHVFGGEKAADAAAVVGVWEKQKQKEKPARDSVLDGLPPELPALLHALKVIEKVSKVGFQWPHLEGPLEKVQEELGEFLAEVKKLGPAAEVTHAKGGALDPELRKKLEGELGDLFFSIANVAYFLQLDPESALRAMLTRFGARFRHVEKRAKEDGKKLPEMTLEEMDKYWAEAKGQKP